MSDNSANYQTYMRYLWIHKVDNVYTIGINEEGLEDIVEITSVDLPTENETIEADVVCGTIETDDGSLDIYSPVSGKVIEINQAVIDDPELIQEDPYDGWLIRVESDDDMDDEDNDDDDDDDDDDELDPEEDEE